MSSEDVFYLLPPPNITGKLHLGHAYCFHLTWFHAHVTNGKLISGADHAGLSAQIKVDPERRLRGELLLRKLRTWSVLSMRDFSREYSEWGLNFGCDIFSLQREMELNVISAYDVLRERGFVYSGQKHLFRDVMNGNVVSDAEVKVVKDSSLPLYYLRYRSAEGGQDLFVATTRPETVYNDVALCVSPLDERYVGSLGQEYVVPLTGRKVRLLAHRLVLPGFGTGVLKITPRYDAKDHRIMVDLGLELGVRIFDDCMKWLVDDAIGLGYMDGEEVVMQKLVKSGLVERVERHEGEVHFINYEDDGVPKRIMVIPVWSDGLFLDLPRLCQRHGHRILADVALLPKWTVDEVRRWVDSIEPWCISRAIRWGTPIPNHSGWVFDTWFNAATWPLLIDRPYDCLITGWDIILFWFIKMALITYEVAGRSAFKRAFFCGLITQDGRKMSKTSGNSILPLEVISRLGMDEFRLNIIRNSTPHKYVKHEESMEVHAVCRKIASVGEFILSRLDSFGSIGQIPFGPVDFTLTFRSLMLDFKFRQAFDYIKWFINDVVSGILCEAAKVSSAAFCCLVKSFGDYLEEISYLTPRLFNRYIIIVGVSRGIKFKRWDGDVDALIPFYFILLLREFEIDAEVTDMVGGRSFCLDFLDFKVLVNLI